MNYYKINVTNGLALIVNPYKEYQDHGPGHFSNMLKNFDWEQFETWLSTQPEITADPSIKDGVYAKELFEEPVWQINNTGDTWDDCRPKRVKYIHDNKTMINGWNYTCRLYIRLKQPVKQEEKHQPAQLTIGDTSFTKLADGFIQILTKNGCVELVPEEIKELSKFINPLTP